MSVAEAQAQVEEFHLAMDLPIGDSRCPCLSDQTLCISLIQEEFDELHRALASRDIVEAADALADLLYVVLAAGVRWGIALGPVFDEVHAANMRKKDGPVRADGKKLKPPGWKPPDVAKVLRNQTGEFRR